jgi:hypothetical protein
LKHQAFKHGFTRIQIEEVLSDPFAGVYRLQLSETGNSRDMFVGRTENGVIVEVGVEYKVDDEVVFHAERASNYSIMESGFDG